MRFLKTFLIVLIFVVSLLFFLQNSAVLSQSIAFNVQLYVNDITWTSPQLPLMVVLILSFFLGTLFTLAFLVLDRLRVGSDLRRWRKNARKLQIEVDSLRKIPITGPVPPKKEI